MHDPGHAALAAQFGRFPTPHEVEQLFALAVGNGVDPADLLDAIAAQGEIAASTDPTLGAAYRRAHEGVSRLASGAAPEPALLQSPIEAAIRALRARTTVGAFRILQRVRPILLRASVSDVDEVFLRAPELTARSERRLDRLMWLAGTEREPVIEIKALLLLAEVRSIASMNRDPRVLETLDRALAKARGFGDPGAIAECLGRVGKTRNRADDGNAATAALEEAISVSVSPIYEATRISQRLELARAYRSAGRYRDAFDAASAALAVAHPNGLRKLTFTIDALLGQLHADLGRYEEAVATFLEIDEILTRAPDAALHHVHADALAGLATAHRLRGRLDQAGAAANRLVSLGRQLDNKNMEAAGLIAVGSTQAAHGDFESARATYFRILEWAAAPLQPPSSPREVDAYLALADIELACGRPRGAQLFAGMALTTGALIQPDRALAQLLAVPTRTFAEGDVDEDRLSTWWREFGAGSHSESARAQVVRGLAAQRFSTGDRDGALSMYRDAVARHPLSERSPMGFGLHLELARTLAADPSTAAEGAGLVRDIIRAIQTSVEEVFLDERRAEIAAEWSDAVALLLAELDGQAEPLPASADIGRRAAEGFEATEAAKSRTMLAELATLPAAQPIHVDAEVLTKEADLLALKREIHADLGEGEIYSFRLGRLREVDAELERLWEMMEQTAPAYVRLRRGRPVSCDDARRTLAAIAPTAALASFWCSDDATTCFILRPDEPRPEALRLAIGRDALESALRALRTAYNGDRTTFFSVPPVDPDYPWSVDDRLGPFREVEERFTALADHLEGVELLCVAPHGALHGLPMHAMRDMRGRFMGERMAITYCPSLSILAHLIESNPRRPTPSAVFVAGTASTSDVNTEYWETDVELFDGTSLTIDGPYTGPSATKIAVLAGLASHEIVHVTCHGHFDDSHFLESGLLLADGHSRPDRTVVGAYQRRRCLLTAKDILQTSLRTHLVTLRACSTGVQGERNRGDEFEGLTRALLYAGSSAVIVSLWNVDAASSRDLLNRFYANWTSSTHHLPMWRALWAAQREFMNGESDGPFRHPYHWAPLTLVGDPR